MNLQGRHVYVAGPYTGDDHIISGNVSKAIAAGETLWSAGAFPLIPHLCHYWDVRYRHHYDEWMRWCLSWVAKCDMLIRLVGPSPGADKEVELALRCQIPSFLAPADAMGPTMTDEEWLNGLVEIKEVPCSTP